MKFRAPKYSCTICNKTFRRSKSHYNHVMRAHRKGTNKKQIVVVQHVDQELVSMKDEIVHSNPQTTNYIGRPYNFNPIHTGNRHLRAGLPLPRISKYRSAAI